MAQVPEGIGQDTRKREAITMGIRRGAEVDALLNEAERQGSCLYTTEKWALNVLRRRKRAGTVIEMDHCSFIRWSTWQRLNPPHAIPLAYQRRGHRPPCCGPRSIACGRMISRTRSRSLTRPYASGPTGLPLKHT